MASAAAAQRGRPAGLAHAPRLGDHAPSPTATPRLPGLAEWPAGVPPRQPAGLARFLAPSDAAGQPASPAAW